MHIKQSYMAGANREIISPSRFASAVRLTEQIKARVKNCSWMRKCFGGVTVIVIQGTPSCRRRRCGLEACLSSHGISHCPFLSWYLFIYLSFFLNSGLSFGNCSRPFVSLYVIPPPPRSRRFFCFGWEKGAVMNRLTMGKQEGPSKLVFLNQSR